MESQIQPKPAQAAARSQRIASWFVRDGRLRSGWRVSLYLIAALFLTLVGAILLQVGFGIIYGTMLIDQGMTPDQARTIIRGMYENFINYPVLAFGIEGSRLGLILALVWLFRRLIDRKSFRSLGFEMPAGWWTELLAGFWLIIVAWGVIFALALAMGAVTITGLTWDTGGWSLVGQSLVVGLVFNIMVGIVEETDARGYILQNLAEGIRIWPAVLVSSAYFGLLHLLNQGAGLASTVGIFFAGLLLALGYYATGRLWFSIGMHAAWNFAEGPIFGFLVSGIRMGGLYQLRVNGPDWLMGGSFGPEAGVLAVVVEIVLIVILYLWARVRRKELVYG